MPIRDPATALFGAEEVELGVAGLSQRMGVDFGRIPKTRNPVLVAAANALYSSARERCPRMIALDEAFVGIDERYKPDLFGLAVKFDLDLFMTGHDLWVTCDTVPMIAHYDMYHDKTTRTVSSLLVLWDGAQLIDASAGLPDNEALATQLLGFRPTRHAPLGTASTLYAAGGEPDGEDEDDDEAG